MSAKLRLNGAQRGDDIPLKFFIGAAGTSYFPASAHKSAIVPPEHSHYIVRIAIPFRFILRTPRYRGVPAIALFPHLAPLGNSSVPGPTHV